MERKHRDFILDFTHVYRDEKEINSGPFTWIDCSDIEGTNLYCSGHAARELGKRLKDFDISGIHFIDSGNYHYVTLLMTERIMEPFSLVLFDHHTDMQRPMAEGMISCGDWAGWVLSQNPHLTQLVLIGPKESDIRDIDNTGKEKLHTVSEEELLSGTGEEKLAGIRTDVPFYISIDKDILNPEFARTNWNQGKISMETLRSVLQFFFRKGKVCGIDICGECGQDAALSEYLSAVKINSRTNAELYSFLRELMAE